MRTD